MIKDLTGKDYEGFVARLQQAILLSEKIATHKNICVEKNKKLIDTHGLEREFDIYWEYDLGGVPYKIIIECRDHNRPISIGQIDGLIGKMRNLPGMRAMFATRLGYQSGAKSQAESNGIDLLVVREHRESDFDSVDGMARIRFLNIHIILQPRPHITSFQPEIDPDWMRKNTSIDPDSMDKKISGRTDQILVESDGKKHSLDDLLKTLATEKGGDFSKTETGENIYLFHKGHRLKMPRYTIGYRTFEPMTDLIEIDIAKEIVGVIEYLQKGTKKSVLRDGTIWDE